MDREGRHGSSADVRTSREIPFPAPGPLENGMGDPSAIDASSTSVSWDYVSPASISSPIVRELPYLELKLEHPDLEPVGYGERFFPDAVPYEFDGTSRIWYWRPALAPASDEPSRWALACATTHELSGSDALPTSGPPLVTESANGTTVVVDGTVGGDVTTNHVRSYAVPDVSVSRRTESTVELTVAGDEYAVARGERRRVRLSERRVTPVERGDGPTTVTPELGIRYPGRRELHHPASGADYRLFPSFGLDLCTVSQPVSVPTAAGELDDAALAAELGVDRAARPYPERVLWQAFAHTAFDPHDDTRPALTQLETGHIVLQRESL